MQGTQGAVPADGAAAATAATAATAAPARRGGGDGEGGALERFPEEVRAELRRVQGQHNLGSVMHGASGADDGEQSWLGSLGALMFEPRDALESAAPIASVIPPVELEDFQEYLLKSRAAVRLFVHNHDIASLARVNAAARRIRLRERLSGDEAAVVNPSGSVRRTLQLAKGLAALQQQQQQQQRRELASGSAAKAALEACFRLVPTRFFEADFTVSLEDGESDSHAAYLMHEKLSGWLDQVEVCLWSQTTSQAHEFFAALSDLSSLRAQVEGACTEIAALRTHILGARRKIAESHLAVLHHKRRRRNVTRLEALVSQIRDVRSCIPTVEKLMQLQDYSGALALLANARGVLRTELRKVHSLQTLQRQMSDFEEMIVEQLKSRFVEIAVGFETAEDQDDGTESPEDAAVAQLVEQLTPVVVGLITARRFQLEEADARANSSANADAASGEDGDREHAGDSGKSPSGALDLLANPMTGALESYREAAIAEVRSSVENGVAMALAEVQAEAEGSAPVTVNRRQLIEMSHESFLTFIGLVFESLTVVMSRAAHLDKALRKCILQTQEQAAEDGPTLGSAESAGDGPSELEASGRVLAKVSELSQSSVGKLYTLRMNACMEQVSLVEFKQLYEKVGAFTIQAERATGLRRGGSLLESLRAQARRFLASTHKHGLENLRKSLNRDQWKAVEVPRSIQGSVRRILSGNPRMDRPPVAASGGPDAVIASKAGGSGRGHASMTLTINGQPCKAVSSVLSLLHALESYMSCAQQLSLSHDTLGLVVEMLRLYNERANRLVLHLEACSDKTAGLSGITTKNLGLASQALTVVLALLPSVRGILVGALPPRSRHLDRDKRDIQLQLEQVSSEYDRHRQRIFDKIVELLTSLLNDCCSAQSLGAVDWDHAQMDQPEPYMLKLTKGIRSVHRVVSKILPPEQLQHVFEMVFKVFNKRIPELFAEVRPTTGVGNVKVYIDLNHLSRCLHMLPGTHGLGDELDVFINQHFPPTASSSRTKEQVASAAAVASEKAESAAAATGPVEMAVEPSMVPEAPAAEEEHIGEGHENGVVDEVLRNGVVKGGETENHDAGEVENGSASGVRPDDVPLFGDDAAAASTTDTDIVKATEDSKENGEHEGVVGDNDEDTNVVDDGEDVDVNDDVHDTTNANDGADADDASGGDAVNAADAAEVRTLSANYEDERESEAEIEEADDAPPRSVEDANAQDERDGDAQAPAPHDDSDEDGKEVGDGEKVVRDDVEMDTGSEDDDQTQGEDLANETD